MRTRPFSFSRITHSIGLFTSPSLSCSYSPNWKASPTLHLFSSALYRICTASLYSPSSVSISVSSAIASEYLLFPIASTALLYLFSIFIAFAQLSKASRTLFAPVYSPLLLDVTARLYSMMGIMILILIKAAAAHSIAAAITMETSFFVLFFLAAASACFLSSSSASRSRRSLYDASSSPASKARIRSLYLCPQAPHLSLRLLFTLPQVQRHISPNRTGTNSACAQVLRAY